VNDPPLEPKTAIEPEYVVPELPDEYPIDNPDKPLKPEYPQPPEQIEPKVLYPGVTPPCRSPGAHQQPQHLIPSFGGKAYESTAGITTNLVHPEAHMDPDYTLVAHIMMVQYSMKAGMRHFKQHGEDAVSKELSQLHLCDTFKPIHSKDLNNEQHK
jgi:hypothetical protein